MLGQRASRFIVLAVAVLFLASGLGVLSFAAGPGPSPSSNASYVHPLSTVLHPSISSDYNPSDSGVSVVFSVTNGQGGYYLFTINGVDEQNTTSTTFTHAFTVTSDSNFTVGVYEWVSSSEYGSGSLVQSVHVKATVTLSVAPTTVDANQTYTLTATVSNGVSPFSYDWYYEPNGTFINNGAAGTYSTSKPSAGIWGYEVVILDADGVQSTSNGVTVTVDSALTVSITSSVSVIDEGMQANFTANATGGSGTYTAYQWYLNGTAQSGATSSTWTTTSLPTGSPTIYVEITDSNSFTAESNTISITVNPPLEVSISSSVNPSDYGESVTFESVVTGGTPPYSYQWNALGQNVSGATSPSWTTSTLPIGQDLIKLYVWDSAGDPAPGHPNASVPRIVMTASPDFSSQGQYMPNTVYIGDDFNVSIAQIGTSIYDGIGYSFWLSNYVFSWYLNETLIPGATDPYYATFEDIPGIYLFSVKIVNTTDVSGIYGGTWWGNWTEHVKANVLPPDSVEFIESGLPNGSVWSANLIVPYGIGFTALTGMDGFYTVVRGTSIPSVIISGLANGTYNFTIGDYIWNATRGYASGSGLYVPSITAGTVTIGNSGNGSVIIRVTFTLIGSSQSPIGHSSKQATPRGPTENVYQSTAANESIRQTFLSAIKEVNL